MPGRIELDGRDLLIRFDYDRRLVEAVRLLPNRRFDARMRTWIVPARHVDVVVGALSPYGFDLAPEVRGLARPAAAGLPFEPAIAVTAAAGDASLAAGPPAPAPRAWTVSMLNYRVRDALRGAFVDGVWVVGEVVDFDKSAGRRHRHFALVEKAEGEARPVAQVEAVLFGDKLDELAHKLRSAQPPLALRDGLEIRVRARVDLYPQSGRFQLVVDDIDPEHTLGKLALTREQILRELRAKGLDGKNSGLPLPRPALRLAVLASPSSDGWHDFRRHLEATGLAFTVTLFPVRVQGIELKRTVLAGLGFFANHAADHDVACILRGGGARSDLSWFDDRELAHAVANHPLKILVGIGHERDRTVLDFIAHSFKTPTAIAAHLADQALAEWLRVDDHRRRLTVAGAARLERERRDLRARATALQAALASHLLAQRHDLQLAAQRLRHAALSRHAARAGRALALATQRLRHAVRGRLVAGATALARAAARVGDGSSRRLERTATHLRAQELRCRLLDPRTVLRRGYALVRRAETGRIVTDAAGIVSGTPLRIEFRDGQIEAEARRAMMPLPPPAP